ncbi:MAG: hypothetical protein AAGB25_01705, partial [Pseudomonadota bacterium]
MSNGRLKLGDVMKDARQGDNDAVKQLFSGFMGHQESVVKCGYLGALGFILPEHSFWCISNKRVCGLLIRAGGRVNFNSGSLDLVNSVAFNQPSLIHLWLFLIGFVLLFLLLAGSLAFAVAEFLLMTLYFNFDVMLFDFRWAFIIGFFLIFAALAVLLLRWIVRIYYRLVKSGCTFWTRETKPVFVFADRHKLAEAQEFMRAFADEKLSYR